MTLSVSMVSVSEWIFAIFILGVACLLCLSALSK